MGKSPDDSLSAFSFHPRRIDGHLGAAWCRGGPANPGEDRLVRGVFGAVPARAADVGEAGRAGWVGTALALGTSRLAEDQARFGLAQVHDLEHRVVVDQELLVRVALGWIGLGDPENRVVGVTARTGIRVFPRLVEEWVDRAPEGCKAEHARSGQGEIGLHAGRVEAGGPEHGLGTGCERGILGQGLHSFSTRWTIRCGPIWI